MPANKDAVIKAAYFACLAIGYTPSVRTVNDMVRRIRTNGTPGQGFRTDDIAEWLRKWETLGKHSGNEPETPIKHKSAPSGNTSEEVGKPTRARHKVLELEASEPNGSAQGSKRRMKQPALDLGAAAPPEVDYDKSRFSMPENLPEQFPDPVDDLKRVAVAFCRAFAGCKTDDALRKHGRPYTDTLAIFRQRNASVAVAWQAFIDAVAAQDWKPLFGAQSKKALAYLPNGRRPFNAKPIGPRVDSCGCPLPDGVFMPRLKTGETAHWDGDEFLFGSDQDPR